MTVNGDGAGKGSSSKPALSLPVFVEHQCLNITGTMNHADNNHLGIREAVIQNIITVKMRP
jgi:hypothetical protein